MRVMRTQESDDEAFQIESQRDLLARRKKVLESGGAKVKASGMEIKSEKSSRKEAREASGSEDSEDGDEAAYRDEKTASRQGKTQHKSSAALRRLRDSISGKEDSPGRKTTGSTQKPQLENRKSPGRNREKESSDEEEEKGDDEDTYEERTGSSSAQNHRSRTGSTNGDTEEGRPRGKRGAATEAAQRLHTIMPDANLFEEQRRKGKIRGEWEGGEREHASTSLKGKRRRESRGSDGEEQGDGEGRKKRRSVLGDTATRDRERSSSVVDAGVRFMTTKVDLTPQQIQGLRKIGFRKVEEPQSCTHLVSNSILRTEKFLCALSYGPKAVKSSWLIDCLAQKKVLDTKDYFLYDAIGERTYGVNLDHTLRRARERPGKLFEGHTFYLSPNMEKLHSTTLTNAIKAAGGMLHTIFPGVRSHYHSSEDQRLYQDLDSHLESKHFVSQKGDKDEDRWEELTSRGVPVYSPDFVLSAILRQQIGDLMDPKVMLARPT
ncbi:hypothetical protein FRC17_004890 [Serendipita sp. 399]|nr:hypothetical protein FRC17_004890 [Serendipita sp. 399]